MAICTICSNVVVAFYPKPDGLEPQRSTEATYPSYDAAAVQSCWICSKFAEWLKDDDDEAWQAWFQGPLTNVFQVETGALIGDGSSDPSSVDMEEDLPADSIGRRKLRIGSMFLWRCLDGEEAGCPIQLDFLRDIDFQGPDMYVSQKSPPGVDIERIREWIKGCKKDHKNCVLSHQIWYPTRLLDLGMPGATMKLIIAKETSPTGPYMTLSHRWGKHVYEQLTSQSEGRFKASIDISTLPRVFQDAIDMTRKLNVRYLWIDSLCIKQDKECGDWKVEALQMGNVYAHSYLNLSASYATEGNDPPLFAPGSLDNTYPCQLEVECDGPLKKDFVVDGELWADEALEAPLMGRGWVFQERFLAPRVLHFGKRQLAWECNGLDALEMFPHGLPRGMGMISKEEVHLAVTLPKESTKRADFCRVWHDLVSKYSACSLTFPSDKLVAFAGVVKMIEARRKDEYIAGAMQSTFLVDLAWFLTEYREGLTPVSETVTRAPSWSWLSLDGEICFYPEIPWADKLTEFASVLGMPASGSVGSSVLVAHGAIRLKGLRLQVKRVIYERSGNVPRKFTVYRHEFEQGPSPESTRLDPDRPKSDIKRLIRDGNLWFVPLYASQAAIVATLVSAIGRTGDYRRVGAAQVQWLKIPHKSEGPHLDGWTPLSGSSHVGHKVAANLYADILKLKDGEESVFNLI
ncbi:heterokaryon incompatibility protein-domain-containing protein [Fusarium solani]|uniref:Heterokaryon incompatibility protein-domain-containing protein n=1 Tax=Fusarium solani TaxID=169388 RepID=A0A9P9GEU0_FUSSL|nr:heterokaryon incompatibility protein-domain-containing protein [Fusarium solani]KAH7237212.1 heterokaryon incompatibility protein-domain-containing protein [Fusarium solani]